MGSHSDKDAPIPAKILSDLTASTDMDRGRAIAEHIRTLDRRAVEISERGTNTITAGVDGEIVELEAKRSGVLIRRLPDDPDNVLRISLGCPEWDDNQAYLVFRGDPMKIGALLQRALKAFGELASTGLR